MADIEPKMNKKKLENLERIKRKKEALISKRKTKKLAQLAERKRIKQTRESLFEMLKEYQLDESSMKLLSSITGKKDHQQQENSGMDNDRTARTSIRPKKLRCVVSSRQQVVDRKQRNHIETDSSSCEEDLTEERGEANQQRMVNDDESACLLKKDERCVNLDPPKSTKGLEIATKKKKIQNIEANSNEFLARIKGQQVCVQRDVDIEKQRSKLPIIGEEQAIVESINENNVAVITGSTGSGKTTQIPQFLYEAGYTSKGHLIGITEPRRIAAISMSSRVGQELGDPKISSYQIRYEGNRTDQTKLLFMTDGVLLKELLSDCTLSRYSVIIIDEAHERSIYSDVLIGLLSRICNVRLKRGYPLKLIIMSATLRLQDFLRERLFSNIQPKVINIESRQFPVAIYFERRTPSNYLEAAFKKVCKIHEHYPPGSILVFVTGQRDVMYLVKLLNNRYNQTMDLKKKRNIRVLQKESNQSETMEEMTLDNDEFGTWDAEDSGEEDAHTSNLFDTDQTIKSNRFPQLIPIPLYSMLPVQLQKRIFDQSPNDGSRICVISTNVAETSLTIPNIRYIIDCGKEKRKEYDPITGVSRFTVDWCSKASADQRSGRAGRTQSGYAFRLFSSAVYEDMRDHSIPEILNKPLDQLVLMLKSMNFAKIVNFPFPTHPSLDQIKSAETRLTHIGALKSHSNGIINITQLGRTLVQFPLTPNFAKLVISSLKDDLLPYSITLVAALSVRESLISIHSMRDDGTNEMEERMAEMLRQRRLWCAVGESRLFGDLTVLLNVVGAADYSANDPKIAHSLGLRHKALKEINKLRSQLVSIVNSSDKLVEKLPEEFRMQPPSQEQFRKLRFKMVKCFPDKIAKKVNLPDSPKDTYKTQLLEEFVFIDSSSMLFKEQPDYVLYQEIVQVSDKKCLQNVIAVDAEWLPDFVTFDGFLKIK